MHAGILPWVWAWRPPGCGPGDTLLGVGLETPSWMWAWRPPGQTLQPSPGCGAGGPPGQTPQPPPGCVPGDPLARPLMLSPGCGVGDLQDMLEYHSLETCKACWDTTPGNLQGKLVYHLQGMLGYHPPRGQNS